MPEAYTIGYGNRKLDDFLSLLQQFGIDAVADVRRFPTSKREEFRKENLEKILKGAGIWYVHLPELGGYRGGYKHHMRTPEFVAGLKKFMRIAENKRTVIMCLEENPRGCHRSYIAEALKKNGWRIFHILRKGELRSSLPPRRR